MSLQLIHCLVVEYSLKIIPSDVDLTSIDDYQYKLTLNLLSSQDI